MPGPDPEVRSRMKLPVHRLQGQLHTELVLFIGLQTWLVTDHILHACGNSHCLLRRGCDWSRIDHLHTWLLTQPCSAYFQLGLSARENGEPSYWLHGHNRMAKRQRMCNVREGTMITMWDQSWGEGYSSAVVSDQSKVMDLTSRLAN